MSNKNLGATLSLFDRFTSTLDKINNGVQATTSNFMGLKKTVESDYRPNTKGFDKMAQQSSNSVGKMAGEQTKSMAQITSWQDSMAANATATQSQATAAFNKTSEAIDNQAEKMRKLAEVEANQTNPFALPSQSGATPSAQPPVNSAPINSLDDVIARAKSQMESMSNPIEQARSQVSMLANDYELVNNAIDNQAAKLDQLTQAANQVSMSGTAEEVAKANQEVLMAQVGFDKLITQSDKLGSELLEANDALNKMSSTANTNPLSKMAGSTEKALTKMVSKTQALKNTFMSIGNAPMASGLAMGERILSKMVTKAGQLKTSLANSKFGNWMSSLNGINGVKKGVDSASNSQMNFNKLINLATFAVAIAAVKKLMNMMDGLASKADNFVQTQARLNLINDGSQSNGALQDKVMAASMRSRSDYGATADTVSKIGLNAPDAFNSNDEMIAFSELLNKSYKIGGASLQEQQSSMTQLTQALAMGALKGQELNSVMAGAPQVIDAIAKELGVTRAELKEMAGDGEITAGVIKNAMFNAADEINDKFKQIPMTFGDMKTMIANSTVEAFQPLFEAFNAFINSGVGQQFMADIQAAIFSIGNAALWMFNMFAVGIAFIQPVFSWFASHLEYVGLALVALGAVAFAVAIFFAAAWIYANWPLLLIIAIVIGIIAILNVMGITAGDIAGFIVGAFFWMGAMIYNVALSFVAVFYTAIALVVNQFIYFINHVVAVAEFFLNVWTNPIYSVQMLFYNMVSNASNVLGSLADASGSAADALANAFIWAANQAIGAINQLVGLLNKIPGINIGTVGEIGSVSGGGNWGNGVRSFGESFNPGPAPEGYKSLGKFNMMDTAAGFDFAADKSLNLGDSFNKGFDKGSGFVNSFGEGLSDFGKFQNMLSGDNTLSNALGGAGGMGGAPGGGSGGQGAGDKLGKGKELGDIGRIKDDVTISDEDIKLMKDVAERDYIIKYQQVTPSATVNFTSTGNTEEDAKKLLEMMEEMIVDQTAVVLI